MSFNVSSFNVDPEKVHNGVVVDLSGGAWVRLAPMFGERYRKAWERVAEPHRREIRAGTLRAEIRWDLENRAMAVGCLLDWFDLSYTKEGVETPVGGYSVKKAYRMLNEIPGLSVKLRELANDWGLFR